MKQQFGSIKMGVFFVVFAGLFASSAQASQKKSLSTEQREVRLSHAQELLGRHYDKSTVRFGENVTKINSFVYHMVKERLPKKYKKDSGKIAQFIIDESLRREFDPVFLMSVIQSESSFIPTRKGGVGEIGLMQLRPETAEWIAGKYKISFKGAETLNDPITNIRIGAAYLHWLRERFDSHARLYLAAYNMGQRNVAGLLEKKTWPKVYPVHVMRNYVDFYSALRERDSKNTDSISRVAGDL